MADDRLPPCRRRSLSMLATRAATVSPRPLAISRRASQNSSSQLTAVLRPPMAIERLGTGDFMMAFPSGGKHFRIEDCILPRLPSPPVSRRGAGPTKALKRSNAGAGATKSIQRFLTRTSWVTASTLSAGTPHGPARQRRLEPRDSGSDRCRPCCTPAVQPLKKKRHNRCISVT
jgi:hypothetical protein